LIFTVGLIVITSLADFSGSQLYEHEEAPVVEEAVAEPVEDLVEEQVDESNELEEEKLIHDEEPDDFNG
jgi:hypothetical protein